MDDIKLKPLAWYEQINGMLVSQQANIFVLWGNIHDYPQFPKESLDQFLVRRVEDEIYDLHPELIAQSRSQDESVVQRVEERIAEHRVIATYDLTRGLKFASRAQQQRFEEVVPPPQQEPNPFGPADAPPSTQDVFEQIQDYLFESIRRPLPALTVVVKRADLVVPKADPPPLSDRPLVDLLCEWASSDLLATQPDPSRLFLVTPDPERLYDHLLRGAVQQVRVPLPDQELRHANIQMHLMPANGEEQYEPPVLDQDLTPEALATLTGSLTLRGIEDIMYQGIMLRDDRVITRQMAQSRKDELVKQQYGGVMEIDYPQITFDDIVGFDELKTHMRGYVLNKLVARDPLCPKGMVLSGPPGTAKTAISGALANAMELPLVSIKMDRIKSKYVGESNQNMAQLIEGITTLAPCIVLADEMDKILGGGEDNTGVTQELQGALQTFLSDIPRGLVFFIATSNYPERIPPAMRRPGRLDMLVPMFPQHLDGLRGQVLACLARRMGLNHDVTEEQFDNIGKLAQDFTGADLELLVSEADIHCTMTTAAEFPSRPVSAVDFCAALDYIVPTVEGTQAMINSTLRLTTNKRFVPKTMWKQMDQARKVEREEEPPEPTSGVRRRFDGRR